MPAASVHEFRHIIFSSWTLYRAYYSFFIIGLFGAWHGHISLSDLFHSDHIGHFPSQSDIASDYSLRTTALATDYLLSIIDAYDRSEENSRTV